MEILPTIVFSMGTGNDTLSAPLDYVYYLYSISFFIFERRNYVPNSIRIPAFSDSSTQIALSSCYQSLAAFSLVDFL